MKITMIEVEATADEIKASQNIGQNIMSILNRALQGQWIMVMTSKRMR